MHSRPRSPLASVLLSCLFILPAFAQRPHFDPGHDYAYDLAATDTKIVNVELSETGFTWAAQLPEGDTLLLEFSLTQTAGAEPSVTAAAGGISLHQVFESGAKGRRFLDLSPLRGTAAGVSVVLTGAGASWQGGAARLFVYRNAPLPAQKVLVVAPHPDDAEIGAFGLYRSTKADVITVTSGDAGG